MSIADMRPVLDRLRAEHAELLPRIERLLELAQFQSPALAATLDADLELLGAPLEAHIALEDDVLFPAYAEATGAHSVVEVFSDEHREILKIRNELRALRQLGVDGKTLATTVLRLTDALMPHQEREEMMLFPSASELMLAAQR
jgi:iron-sulfur cluster repair protein YtfE (RIC family)